MTRTPPASALAKYVPWLLAFAPVGQPEPHQPQYMQAGRPSYSMELTAIGGANGCAPAFLAPLASTCACQLIRCGCIGSEYDSCENGPHSPATPKSRSTLA